MAEEITPSNQYPERNEAAFFAQQYLEAGKRLDLGPSIEQQSDGSFDVAKLDAPEDTARFYEENPHLGIDLDAPDAEQNWNNIREALKKRHTDYLELFGETVGEIAKIPVGLAEGIVENGLTPTGIAKTAYSTVEGAARGLRDMWGIAAQSENPDSLLFNFRSLLGAVMNGKISKDWREEAQQWNEARKFLYHSHLMSQGDETLLEQFSSLNLSEETKNNLRNMVNPKVAHAMAFMGLELPSLIAAPFTGGASAELAIAAGTTQMALNAKRAANATIISKIGNRMAKATQDFERMAGRFSETIAGNAAYGLGKAIQPLATMSESIFGGTIEAVAARSGYVAKELENAATVTAMNVGEAAMGANATRQTVGFIGSFGLRTSSELLQELGDTLLQRASGVIPVSEINGLTVLERLASAKHLSPSARYAAKAANVLVDPFVQMSTAALKNSYKDAMIFGGLGYANDQMRGAVGGAATGMVWGGYSGAFRHTWANINGGFHSAQVIENFDRNFLPQIETQNSKFSSFTRGILTEVDALKSTKISANTRFALQTAWLSLSTADRANAILVHGSTKELVNIATNAGIKGLGVPESTKGFFTTRMDSAGVERPILFINKDYYRPVEVGHEIMSHLVTHSLITKGKGGEYFRQLIGTEKDGGAMQSDKLLLHDAVKRWVTEEIVEKADVYGWKKGMASAEADRILNAKGKELYETAYKNAEVALDSLRRDAAADPLFWANQRWKEANYGEFVQRYLFEETIAKHSEGLFLHTNLSEITADARMKPMRLVIERMRNEIFAKQITEMELAGIRAKQFFENGNPVIQAEVYDGGKYHRHEGVEGVIRSMIREATMADTNPIQKLSPERQAIEAKRYGKEYLFKFAGKGATMLGTKEQNEIFSRNAMKGMSVLESLPDQFRPEFIVDEHGNRAVDMYELKDEAYDALVAAGVMDKHSAETAMGMRDGMKRWEASGFAESNIFASFYWGDSHRISKDGLYQRLFGKDVPVTYRVFVPFELKMSFKTTDANGKPLRNPKGGMVATVVDVMAIHRRKIRLWQRPDIHRLFINEAHYASTFDKYLVNMMKDPSTRVPSAELFRNDFGTKAEAVRDACYETFGGRKRADEGYINAPREGYSSNPENPDYPIHSMKLELIVGAERMGGIKPLPYHHGRSYEGLRRNYSVGGFAVYGGNANRLQNAQGYEISVRNDKFKVFSPFGVMVGVFDSVKKAIKAANKDMKKLDEADIMPMPTAIEEAKIQTEKANVQEKNLGRSTMLSTTYDNGIRLSGGIVGPDGVTRFYREDFVNNIFDVISRVHDAMWKDPVTGNYVEKRKVTASTVVDTRVPHDNALTLSSLQNDNGAAMDAVLRASDAPFMTKDIAVYPSGDKAPRGAPVLKVFHSESGTYWSVYKSEQSGKLAVVMDMDAILTNAGGSKQKADFMVRAIVSKATSDLLRTYGKDGEFVGGYLAHPETKKDINAQLFVDFFTGQLEYNTATMKPYRELAERSAKTRMQSQIKPFDGDFDYDSNGNVFFRMGGDFSKVKNIREFNKLLQGRGINVSTPSSLRSSSASRALSILKSIYDVQREMADNAQFVFEPNPNGPEMLRARPVMVGGKFKQKFAKVYQELFSAMSAEPANAEYYAMLGKLVSHSIIQVHSSRLIEEFSIKNPQLDAISQKWGRNQFVINPKLVGENYGNTEIVRVDAGRAGSGGEMLSTTNMGAVIVVDDVGGNHIVGSMGGDADVGYNRSSSFANKSTRFHDDFVPIGSVDGVIFDKLFNLHVRDSFIKDKRHLFVLAAISSFEMANEEPKIFKALVDTVSGKMSDMDFVKLVEELSIINEKDSSFIGSNAVASLVLSHDANHLAGLNKTPDQMARYADWGKSMFNKWLSDYYALSTGKDFINGNKALDTFYKRSQQALGNWGIESQAAYKSLLNTLSNIYGKDSTPTSIRGGGLSVGELSVVKDDAKLRELRAKGLVKTIKFNGQDINIFEFSDAAASLNLSRAAGRPHILPFLSAADPEVAFSEYAAAVRRRATLPANQRFIPENIVLGEARLGDIFHHQELYEYYPEFRDMKVRFKDFHGGRHTYIGDKGVIELGVRSFAAAELNMPAEQGGMIFNNKEGLRSEWIKRNPLSSIILHEVQHAIQLKHGWIGTHVGINNLPQEIAAHYLANLLGAKTSLSLKSRLDAELARPEIAIKNGRFIDPSTLNDAAKTEAELRDRMVLAASSPVIRSFRSNAKPLIESAARNLADFVTAEHESGRVPDHFASKVIDLHQKAKFALNVDDAIAIYMDMAELRKEAILTLPEYSFYMHDNVQFRSAFTAMGLVTNFDLVSHATPTEVSTLLATAVGNYQELAYLMEPVEKMARETEARRGMSEAELAQNERTITDDYNRDPVLRLIRNSMDMSKLGSELDFAKTISSQGIPSLIMKSVGGLGEVDTADSQVLTGLGKAVLMQTVAIQSHEILETLKRTVLMTQGWTVDKDGNMRLVSGKHVLKGVSNDEFAKNLRAVLGEDAVLSSDNGKSGVQTTYVVDPMSLVGEGYTYSMEEIAVLAGATIESASSITVGNSAIDAVLSPMFPPTFKASDATRLFAESGMATQEAMRASRVEKIIESLGDTVITKNDLVNLMAANHSNFVQAMAVSGERGPIEYRTELATRTLSNLSPEGKRSIIENMGVAEQAFIAANELDGLYSSSTKNFKVGGFVLTGRELKFEAERAAPSWVIDLGEESVGAWKAMCERVSKHITRDIQTNYVGSGSNMAPTYEILKKRYMAKALMIQPMVDAAIKKLMSESYPEDVKVNMAINVMSEIEKAHIIISAVDIGAPKNWFEYDFNDLNSNTTRTDRQRAERLTGRLNAGDKPLAIGGKYQGGREFMPPQLSTAIFSPFVAEGRDASGVATSTLYEVSTPTSRLTGSSSAHVYATSNLGLDPALSERINRDAGYYIQQMEKDTASNMVGQLQQTLDEWKQMAENMRRALRDRIDGDVEGLGGEIQRLTVEEAKSILHSIESKLSDERMSREQEIISRLTNNNPFEIANDHKSLRESPSSVFESSVAVGASRDREVLGLSTTIANAQGMVVGDAAIINVESIPVNRNVGINFPSYGHVGSMVPPRIRSTYVRYKTYGDLATQAGLFAVARMDDGTRHGVVERLSGMADTVDDISGYGDASAMVSIDNAHLAHAIGGNMVLTVGNFIYEMAKSEVEPEAFVTAKTDALRAMYANDGVWGKTTPNANPRMVGAAGQNAITISNRTIGAAAAAPMGTFLRTGYMDFWKNNKELTVDVPDCFRSEAFEELVAMFGESNWASGRTIKPEAMDALRRFVGLLDDRTVDILVTEMTSLPNVRTITDTAAFFNIKKFVEKHSAMTEAEREAYPFFVGKNKSENYVNYAFAQGVHHGVALHAAAKDAKFGFPKESVMAFTKAMKQAIRTEDFWFGLFAVQGDLITSNEFLRPRVNTGNTNLFHYRSDIDSGRHPSVFRFESASPARHSIEMGNSIDAHTKLTIPSYSTHPSSERLPYNSTTLKQDVFRVEADRGQEMSMEFMDGHSLFGMDTLENLRTNENAAKIRSSSLNQNLGMGFRSAGNKSTMPMTVLNEDIGGEVSREGMTSASEQIRYPAIPKPVTDGSRRALILNQMANMASALGVDKVAIQPARFSASTRVSPSIIGQPTIKQVVENFAGTSVNTTSRLLNNALGVGTLYRGMSSVQDRPRSGFAWNRLPDGRIIVNYSPNMEIHSVFDRSISAVSRKQDLGLNLFRAIGYNANDNGIIIPQSYRRQASLVNDGFRALGNFHGQTNKDFGKLMLSKIARTLGNLDPEVIEHHESAARSILQKGVFGDAMTQHALGLINPERSNNHGVNYSKQILGGGVAPLMDIEGLYEYGKKTSPILELSNPENGYVTFILPKDATVEDFKREVLYRHMMAKGLFAENGSPFSEVPSGIDRTIIGRTDGWGAGMDTAARYQRIMSTIPENVSNMEINTFKEGSQSGTDAGRVGANYYARALREVALVNQNFVPNLEKAFSMMASSERGYHVPESEHILSQSGDRLEVIKAMFPDRKDLEVFAWDNPSNLNLSIVAPSRGAAKVWRVGYDEIVGADAAGNPMRNRVVKPFSSESEANNFAASLSKNGIVAEQIKALNAEGEISIERVASKPNSDAMVHQGMEFNMGYDGKEDGRVMTASSGWYVGNFQRRFNTQAEAQAFSALVTRPEVVTAKSPKHTSIRLSAGELENMDRQLRERISFRTDGSAIQFSSNAMNALARGVDKHKRFKDKATGTEWYDMLTFNAVSKAEMRVTGLASFLWDHRAVNLTRKEVAEFLFTMYPNMGRTSLYGESSNRALKIPEVINPQLAMQSHLSQYNALMTNTFRVLEAKAAEADAAGNAQLAAFHDQLKQMHLDAMHKALEPYMGLEEAKKRFPDITSLERVLSNAEKSEEVNGGVLEMYRNHYNDLVKGMTQEQMNVLSGVDISLPDPSTIFDSSNPRPHYLNLITAAPVADTRLMDPKVGGNQSIYTEGRTGQDWGTYTTAASGPYQVDLLYGHVPVSSQRLTEYTSKLRSLADNATDPAEKARLESMIGSAERVNAVRRAASDKARQSGHWSTPERTMQYSHLRYSGAISMRETLPNAPLSELANELLTTRPQDQQAEPVLFAEELQSDPYQRSTFGPSKDVTKLLPSDFKQAEAQQLIPELAEINKQLAVFDASLEVKQYGFKWANDWPRENNQRRLESVLAERFYGRMSLAEKNMLLQYYLTRVNSDFADQIVYGEVKRTLSRELSNKLGIAPELREFDFPNKVVRDDFMSFVANQVLSQTTFEHVPETTFKLFGINQDSKVPNLGDLTFKSYWAHNRGRTFKGHGGMIYGVLGAMALSDERIHSAAEAIAKHGDFRVNQIGHGVDFDSIAAEYADKLSSKASDSGATIDKSKLRYLTILADDMRHLARTRGYGMEHIVKDFVEDRFFAREHLPNGRRVFKEPGGNGNYLALNLQEAVRKESSMTLERMDESDKPRYREYANEFWKHADEGRIDSINSRLLRSALMFESETGRIVEKDLIETLVQNDDFSFNTLYGVDRDMDASSGHWSGMHYLAFPHQAKTTLGRILEIQSHYIAQSIYQHTGDSKANALRERRTQIMSSLKMEDKDFSYPDTIPLGEDNAYRELSVRFYGLRALQSQKRGVVVADARHHRHRYHSEGHMAHTISLGKGLVLPMTGIQDRTIPYFFMRAAEDKSNNDFIGRVMSEGIRAMVNPNTGLIEHNGVGAQFTEHLINTFMEYRNKSNTIVPRTQFTPDNLRSIIQGLRINVDESSGGRSLETVVSGILRGDTPFLSEEQRLGLFGSVLQEGDDVYKRIAKTVANPQFLMQNVPVNKTHGYAVNYGAPHWNNRVYYAGLPADFVLKQSHDMFLRPMVELKDGKYNILDPKTGKLLIGGIENHSEMIERAAQLSKYLGSVPFVSIFLKTFGKVGAYAMDGHIWEGTAGKTHTYKMGGHAEVTSVEPAMSQFKSLRAVAHRPMPSTELEFAAGQNVPESFFGRNTLMQTSARGEGENPWTIGDVRARNQQRDAAEFGFQSPAQNDFAFQMNYAAAYADAMGLMANSDHTEMAAALNKMTGFNGPMLIIKPKFATEQHRMEMAKLIRSGLPLLSVGDLANPNARAVEAMKTFKYYQNMRTIGTHPDDETR